MNIVWIIVLRQQQPLGVWKLIDEIVLVQILQELKGMNRASEASVTNIAHEGDSSSEYKDIGTSSPTRNELTSNNAWPNAFVSSAGKTSDTGPEDGRLVDCVSNEPEEFVSHLAQIEAECGDSNEEPLPENIERDPEVSENHYSGTAEALASDALLFKNHNTAEQLAFTKRSRNGKLAHIEYIPDENADNKITPLCTYLHPMVEQCCPADTQTLGLKSSLRSQHSWFNLLATKNELSDRGIITSQSSDEQMPCILPVWQKEKSALIKSPLSVNRISNERKKGKERVSNAGANKSVSMEKDDSHESAESSNSKEPCAKGKRVWSYAQETLMGNKRMRKSIDMNSNSCAGSHVQEDSSFMNWISNVTKGFFKSDHVDKHSLDFIAHPVPKTPSNLFSCRRPNDSDHNAACRDIGFGSIFRALYCPRLGKPMKTGSPDHQEEYADFTKKYFNRPAGSVKAVPMSSVRNDQDMFKFREPPFAAPSLSLRNSPIQEKMKHNMEEYYNLCNVGSSSSSFQNHSSSSEGKEVGKCGTFEPNKFSNLSITNKVDRFPASLWITRFSPKVAALTPCEKLTVDCPKFLHYSQKEKFSVRDCSNSENVHVSSEERRPCSSGPLHEYPTSPLDSCGLKKVHTDPKTQFKLDPILPSQTLKRLEPMTSVFAKRLDAFRHLRTSEIQDDVTPESAACFFCGKNGHTITACSDVIESEHKDLLQKMNSYGRAEKPSCICIRCLLHDHWAVACPYASLSHHHIDSNTCDIDPKNFDRKIEGHGSDSPLITDYDIGMCSKGDNGQGQFPSAYGMPCGEISGTISEVQTSISVDILDMINFNGSVLSSYLSKDDYGKTEAKGKQIASTSTEIEPIGKTLIQTIDMNNKRDKQCLIFERIRKLRLSRTEIIRWMESSISHFSLVGFFLRVRIGKWEEDLGGTGYHVACISGSSGQRMYGCSRSHLPVDVGGSRCLIDCRFVSNHDFTEDELKAWWSATLRRGGKLPSEEDLDKKVKEREELTFNHK